MRRVTPIVWGLVLLVASVCLSICPNICYAQSLADAARANRKQKLQNASTAPKVITSDDLTAPSDDVTIQLVPGTRDARCARIGKA